jgi:hypothetical protein
MEMPNVCVLCGLTAVDGVEWHRLGWGLYAKCPRCGAYAFSESVYLDVFIRQAGRDAFLLCATRQHWELTGQVLVLDQNADELAKAHSHTRVADNVERLLAFIGIRVRRPSESVVIKQHLDFPVIDAETPGDLAVYLAWLVEQGLIVDSGRAGIHTVNLTLKGWDRLQPSTQIGGSPGTCFIAMWFDPSMNEAYELGILPAIEIDCGFKALRVDRKEHNNQITDEIMAGIRSAHFMVAEFTGHRAGVYYDAGFARGLGREVIYCCREDSFKERHFDTSVINHVVWTAPADLRKKLADRIRATILPKA